MKDHFENIKEMKTKHQEEQKKLLMNFKERKEYLKNQFEMILKNNLNEDMILKYFD